MDDIRRKEVDALLEGGPSTATLVPYGTHEAQTLFPEAPKQELMPAGAALLAIPLHVIPPERAERLERISIKLLEVQITDEGSYRYLSDAIKAAELEMKVQKEYVTELRRPFGEVQDRISTESKQGLILPERAVAEAKARVREYLEEQERIREAQVKAAAAAQAEADRKQREAAEAQRREIEQKRLEAEAKQREAERLAFEAQERERKAVADAEAAGNSAKARAKLAQQLAENAERDRLAEVARMEADQQARELAALEAVPVPVVEAQVVEVIGQVQTKGSAAIKKVPKIDGIVLGQLPVDYHMADEKKILKALGMGLTVPGVTYHMESEIKSSRGSLK